MTEDEAEALSEMIYAMQSCASATCTAVGFAMPDVSYVYYDDNWDCDYYDEGCEGEYDGDQTAYVSRGGSGGTGADAWYEASTAMHEAIHYAFGTDEEGTLAIESACEEEIQWWG